MQLNNHPLLVALVRKGILTEESLKEISQAAVQRHLHPATLLVYEHKLSRSLLLKTLMEIYGCASLEYDERRPAPLDVLPKLSAETLLKEEWFPVILEENGSLTIAAVDPASPSLAASVKQQLGCHIFVCMVTLPEDVQWFVQNYLHAPPGELIGTERTELAYWRNTMAQWRTLLACCRTDMAKARTALAVVRFGMSLASIAITLLRVGSLRLPVLAVLSVLTFGLLCSIFGLLVYLQVRKAHLSPPRSKKITEVTAAVISFLEQYHFPEKIKNAAPPPCQAATTLARLGELLADYSTIIFPAPPSRERTHLARERNVLAAQRTVTACYRTIYARARTGLAFIRTGISFFSFGVGLLVYFQRSLISVFDLGLMTVGMLMVIDGLLWYLPVRKEQAELPRSRSTALADWENDV